MLRACRGTFPAASYSLRAAADERDLKSKKEEDNSRTYRSTHGFGRRAGGDDDKADGKSAKKKQKEHHFDSLVCFVAPLHCAGLCVAGIRSHLTPRRPPPAARRRRRLPPAAFRRARPPPAALRWRAGEGVQGAAFQERGPALQGAACLAAAVHGHQRSGKYTHENNTHTFPWLCDFLSTIVCFEQNQWTPTDVMTESRGVCVCVLLSNVLSNS